MKLAPLLFCWPLCEAAWAQQRKPATEEARRGKITVTQTAVFDTVAAYAEGKVLNYRTHRPITGATINIFYDGGRALGTAVSTHNGQFQVGWVSVGKDRLVRVTATGFQPLAKKETCLKDGYSNYLLVELLPAVH